MKYLILLGDGMADWPLPEYDGRTPIEVAKTPAMDALVARGMTGQFCPIPDGLPAGSDIGNLSLFGYNPKASFRGRAPIEAANQGIPLAANQVAYRCNLVTIEDGIMRDFTAGHIATEEAAEIIEHHTLWNEDVYLNPCRPQRGTWKFDRAGWAPGSLVLPWRVDVSSILPNQTALTITYELDPYLNEARGQTWAPHHWTDAIIVFTLT